MIIVFDIQNPQDICVELKACNQTLLENIQTTSLDNAISVRKNVFGF
jgi:hypothetical protein